MHPLLLLASLRVDPETVVAPALSTLDKTVIGSLLVLSWVLAIALVVQLIRVQNARVEDQKALSTKSEHLIAKMTTAFSDMKAALESLKEAERAGVTAVDTLRNSIEALRRSFDIFLIAGGQKKFTPPSGTSKAAILEAQAEQERKKREGG